MYKTYNFPVYFNDAHHCFSCYGLMDSHDKYAQTLYHTHCIYTNFQFAAHTNAIILLRASDNYARGSIMGSAQHIHGAQKGCILLATDRIMKLLMIGFINARVLSYPNLVWYIHVALKSCHLHGDAYMHKESLFSYLYAQIQNTEIYDHNQSNGFSYLLLIIDCYWIV